MTHARIRIEEMEYRPETKTLMILAIDEFNSIVTLEIAGAYPRQLAADLEFVARHPDTRIVLDGHEGRPAPSARPADGSER